MFIFRYLEGKGEREKTLDYLFFNKWITTLFVFDVINYIM